MSRVARIVVPGFPHPITQRGNRTMDVFETDEDRLAYLRPQRRDRHPKNSTVVVAMIMAWSCFLGSQSLLCFDITQRVTRKRDVLEIQGQTTQ